MERHHEQIVFQCFFHSHDLTFVFGSSPFPRPSLSFLNTKDGLYVLLRPEKKKGPRSYAPRHLEQLLEDGIRPEFVQWSLSGPQFPQPTAIQQRYCYPKGEHEYCYRKGGSLWTMYGPDGRENLDFRLLHVYFSTKRAQNKGVSAMEIEEEQKRQRDEVTESGSVSSSSTTTTQKRKVSRIAYDRSVPSPWQQNHGAYPYPPGMAATPPDYGQPPPPPPPHGMGYNMGYNPHHHHHYRPSPGRPPMPPPSPCRSQQYPGAPTTRPPMYVSPSNTSAASQQGIPYTYSNGGYPTEDQPFHPLASFDAEDVDASVNALSRLVDKSQHSRRDSDGSPPSDVFRSRESFEKTHLRQDSHAQIQHLLNDEHFETSLVDLETAWKNDPELQINLTFSRDAQEAAAAQVPSPRGEMNSEQLLVRRLEYLHEKIRQGVLDHRPEERGALVSIIAGWAREVARSPLERLTLGQPESMIGAAAAPAAAQAAQPNPRGQAATSGNDRKPIAAV